jgi:ATP-binding cassette subfamily A (ABC1) protein 3
MYPSTFGTAFINGIEVGTNNSNKSLGVCPQFDILWDSLTVAEHMKFYCLLKGTNQRNIEDSIT